MNERSLPSSLKPPTGLPRLSNPESVEAGYRYWSAVVERTPRNSPGRRVAEEMQLVYAQARNNLSPARGPLPVRRRQSRVS